MKNFKIYYINIFFICFSFSLIAQDTTTEYIETEAVIQEINFKVRSRRSSATAKVAYKTLEGDSLTSTVKLMHIPFIGPLDNEGDTIKILYNKETPLLLTTKSNSLWQSYGLYVLILIGVIIIIYRFIKRPK
ncbi:hypothetical protein SAMN04487910_0043 [Aquimarina amphilecti]|uniref:Uncharacterized protein n=1 Tax=Aquimarina amphilecti TaxID=1038014 RepID=A0A1H7FC93_AQUAM|nr:hypothetical protein [Aquimarina amphilecti]SEK23783.1 hypothetical protein SAMN04487910_0043 [Aquimarina amphilecti]